MFTKSSGLSKELQQVKAQNERGNQLIHGHLKNAL